MEIIRAEGLRFAYEGQETPVLNDVSLSIQKGEWLTIVGHNGSGKSTFVKLLTRLYMPTEGEILLNGKNINEYDYLQYSRLFSSVFQDFALYNLSLGENIVMADEYHFERLESAVRESGLSSLVSSNKNGYDTIIYKWYDPEGSALQSLGRVTTAGISISWTSPPPRWIRWRNMKFIPNSIA